MAINKVKISIPFKSLAESLSELSLEEKVKLLALLEQQIAQADEDELERDPKVRAEIQEAREAIIRGDYLTLDEYIQQRA